MGAKDKRELFGGGGRGGDEPSLASRRANDELVREIERVERGLDELRAMYELYFMGIERIEPSQSRDKWKTRLRKLKDSKLTNTALKYRIQQLGARMISLETYWKRTVRQKEAGTYSRDLARLKRKQAHPKPAPQEATQEEIPKVATPLERRASTSARPRASSQADLTDEKLRRIYDTYIGARKRCGENDSIRFEDVARSLRKQMPALLEKSSTKAVEFKVVIRSGRAVLKAVPR